MSKRIRYGQEKRWGGFQPLPKCHDCAVVVGKLHIEGCDVEECETCGGQRISCECCTICRSNGDTWGVCGNCIKCIERAADRIERLESTIHDVRDIVFRALDDDESDDFEPRRGHSQAYVSGWENGMVTLGEAIRRALAGEADDAPR